MMQPYPRCDSICKNPSRVLEESTTCISFPCSEGEWLVWFHVQSILSICIHAVGLIYAHAYLQKEVHKDGHGGGKPKTLDTAGLISLLTCSLASCDKNCCPSFSTSALHQQRLKQYPGFAAFLHARGLPQAHQCAHWIWCGWHSYVHVDTQPLASSWTIQWEWLKMIQFHKIKCHD